jgi:hypothetical protein
MNPQVYVVSCYEIQLLIANSSVINLVILALMAVVCAIANSILDSEVRFYPLGAPWLYLDNSADDNPRINGIVTWALSHPVEALSVKLGGSANGHNGVKSIIRALNF